MLYSGSEGLLLPLAMKHPPSPQNDLFSSLCNLSGERVTGPHFFSFPESIDYLFYILFYFSLPLLNYVSYSLQVGFTYFGLVFLLEHPPPSLPSSCSQAQLRSQSVQSQVRVREEEETGKGETGEKQCNENRRK